MLCIAERLAYGKSNVLRWRRNDQLVVEAALLALAGPRHLEQFAAADRKLGSRHCEVHVKRARSQGNIHTWKPCSGPSHLTRQ